IIRMRNWIACSTCSILFLSLFVLFLVLPFSVRSQSLTTSPVRYQHYSSANPGSVKWNRSFIDSVNNGLQNSYPDPYSVLYKSMIIPGWGQIVNRQVWKVPIIYGLLGGLSWYSIHLTKK